MKNLTVFFLISFLMVFSMQAAEEASGGARDGSTEQKKQENIATEFIIEGTEEQLNHIKNVLAIAAKDPKDRTLEEQNKLNTIFESEEEAKSIELISKLIK